MSDDNRINAILKSKEFQALSKRFKQSSVLVRASEARTSKVYRISSGIFSYDIALGGGFQVGRSHVVYGMPSSSKSTTLFKTIGNAQKMCSRCYKYNWECECSQGAREFVSVFIDAEGTFDNNWAEANGVNLENLLLHRPECAEHAVDVIDATLRSMECDLMAVDSIAFMTPIKEIEESTDKDMMGVHPRIINKMVRKLNAAMAAVEQAEDWRPTVLFTNQLRHKLGVMFGNPEVMPGGFGPQYATTTETRFSAGKYEIDKETGVPLWADFAFKVNKNKSAPPKQAGTYRLMFVDTDTKSASDVYDEKDILKVAEDVGVLVKGSGKWMCLDEDYPTRKAIEEKMLRDSQFKATLRMTAMRVKLSSLSIV